MQAGRPAIDGERSGEAQAARAGRSTASCIEDVARPIIYLHARQATCWQPEVKNLTLMVTSQYNRLAFRGCVAR